MTTLPTLLAKADQQRAALASTEAAIKVAEREYWTAQGYSVMPRRERLLAALREDAEAPLPIEEYISAHSN